MNRKLKLQELNRVNLEDYQETDKLPLVVVLDNIRIGHNVGSIFRTSDAYLVEKIILCGITATPPQKDIEKTAIGATNSVKWNYSTSTLEAVELLKKEGYTIVCVEQTEKSINMDDFDNTSVEKIALVLGNEVKGVDQKVIDISDLSVELPQFGTKHSLNVSVCSGIVIWEFAKKWITAR